MVDQIFNNNKKKKSDFFPEKVLWVGLGLGSGLGIGSKVVFREDFDIVHLIILDAHVDQTKFPDFHFYPPDFHFYPI